jgi:hypothetical protein
MQLEVLAIQSGGRVMGPGFDIPGMIQRCIEGADDFYRLTFGPPRTSTVDEYHDFVEVDRPDVRVRTNTGYYDEPVFYDQPPVLKPIALAELEEVLTKARGRHDEDLAHQLRTGTDRTDERRGVDAVDGADAWNKIALDADCSGRRVGVSETGGPRERRLIRCGADALPLKLQQARKALEFGEHRRDVSTASLGGPSHLAIEGLAVFAYIVGDGDGLDVEFSSLQSLA